MTSTQIMAPLLEFWQDWALALLLTLGLAGVGLLAAMVVWARKTSKPLRPIALAVSMNLALLLNAEGMWVIAVDRLKLPAIFAVLVFAVFEICFLTATSLAAEQYRRTTVYAPDGTVVTPGHPGRMLWVAALIAGLSGLVVASNAATFTEQLLRLAIPAIIFLMWWAALTAAGQRYIRSRFAYSPRRLAERWGWLIPDEDTDLDRLRADRQVLRMVVAHQRVAAKRWPAAWWKSRLQKDARTASEVVVARVVEQLARIDTVMALLDPDRAPVDPEPRTEQPAEEPPRPSIPSVLAAQAKADRVRRMSLRRRVCARHPVVRVKPVQMPREDPRTAQDKALLVRAVKAFSPDMSSGRIATVVDLPASTVRHHLSRPWSTGPAQKVNGHDVLVGGDS